MDRVIDNDDPRGITSSANWQGGGGYKFYELAPTLIVKDGHGKPYRTLRKAQQKAARAHTDLAWQTALRDNPELQRKNALAKWVQKQKIKRKYAQAAHEAKQSAKFTQNVLTATGKIARAIAQYAAAHKAVFLAVAMLALVVMFFATGLTSCTAMLSGFQSS